LPLLSYRRKEPKEWSKPPSLFGGTPCSPSSRCLLPRNDRPPGRTRYTGDILLTGSFGRHQSAGQSGREPLPGSKPLPISITIPATILDQDPGMIPFERHSPMAQKRLSESKSSFWALSSYTTARVCPPAEVRRAPKIPKSPSLFGGTRCSPALEPASLRYDRPEPMRAYRQLEMAGLAWVTAPKNSGPGDGIARACAKFLCPAGRGHPVTAAALRGGGLLPGRPRSGSCCCVRPGSWRTCRRHSGRRRRTGTCGPGTA